MKTILLLSVVCVYAQQQHAHQQPQLPQQQPLQTNLKCHVGDLEEVVKSHFELISDDRSHSTQEDLDTARIKTFLTLMYVQLDPENLKNIKDALATNNPNEAGDDRLKKNLLPKFKRLYWAVAIADEDLAQITNALEFMSQETLKTLNKNIKFSPKALSIAAAGDEKQDAIRAISCRISRTELMMTRK